MGGGSMKPVTLSIVLALLLCGSVATAWSPSPSSAERAATFVGVLAADSPKHDGVPLRLYEIRDVDYDGRFEVLEHRSDIEERLTGYLSIEWAAPTYWITIFAERNGKFREATAEFQWFLQLRVAFYEHWIRVLEGSGRGQPGVLEAARSNLARARRLRTKGAN